MITSETLFVLKFSDSIAYIIYIKQRIENNIHNVYLRIVAVAFYI